MLKELFGNAKPTYRKEFAKVFTKDVPDDWMTVIWKSNGTMLDSYDFTDISEILI